MTWELPQLLANFSMTPALLSMGSLHLRQPQAASLRNGNFSLHLVDGNAPASATAHFVQFPNVSTLRMSLTPGQGSLAMNTDTYRETGSYSKTPHLVFDQQVEWAPT